jgi:hypothetical protein
MNYSTMSYSSILFLKRGGSGKTMLCEHLAVVIPTKWLSVLIAPFELMVAGRMMRTGGRKLPLRRTPREILLPATFGGLIGREEGLDPQFLQRDVLRRTQSHDSAEQS